MPTPSRKYLLASILFFFFDCMLISGDLWLRGRGEILGPDSVKLLEVTRWCCHCFLQPLPTWKSRVFLSFIFTRWRKRGLSSQSSLGESPESTQNWFALTCVLPHLWLPPLSSLNTNGRASLSDALGNPRWFCPGCQRHIPDLNWSASWLPLPNPSAHLACRHMWIPAQIFWGKKKIFKIRQK